MAVTAPVIDTLERMAWLQAGQWVLSNFWKSDLVPGGPAWESGPNQSSVLTQLRLWCHGSSPPNTTSPSLEHPASVSLGSAIPGFLQGWVQAPSPSATFLDPLGSLFTPGSCAAPSARWVLEPQGSQQQAPPGLAV